LKVNTLPQQQNNKGRDAVSVACYRSRSGAEIAARLEAAAGGDVKIIVEADLIRAAAGVSNVWHGSDLMNRDGELYDGAGVLFSSGCRLDPSYMKAVRSRARVRVREAMLSVSPHGSERWRLVTLTMPTLHGSSLHRTLEVFNAAWSIMRKRLWWRSNVRAGIKGEEFTLGDLKRIRREGREWDSEQDGYHVHAHVLVLSGWLKWQELGEEWTCCLERAAKRAEVPLTLNTSHGRAVVDVRLVVPRTKGKARGVVSEAGAVEEVCKYITKPDSFMKLPDSHLCEVVHALRGRRMIELLGELNKRRGSQRGRLTAAEREAAADAKARLLFLQQQAARMAEWVENDPRTPDAGAMVCHEPTPADCEDWWKSRPSDAAFSYLDTEKTIDGEAGAQSKRDKRIRPRRRRKKPLKVLGAEMIAAGERVKWLELLDEHVRTVKEYRRAMLSERYPLATFSTLDGGRWHGLRANPASLDVARQSATKGWREASSIM
jgi:hypothetical protein